MCSWLNNTHEQLRELIKTPEEIEEQYAMQAVYKRELDNLEHRLKAYVSEILPKAYASSPSVCLQPVKLTEINPLSYVPTFSTLPSAKTWKDLLQYFFIADTSSHLYHPVGLIINDKTGSIFSYMYD